MVRAQRRAASARARRYGPAAVVRIPEPEHRGGRGGTGWPTPGRCAADLLSTLRSSATYCSGRSYDVGLRWFRSTRTLRSSNPDESIIDAVSRRSSPPRRTGRLPFRRSGPRTRPGTIVRHMAGVDDLAEAIEEPRRRCRHPGTDDDAIASPRDASPRTVFVR